MIDHARPCDDSQLHLLLHGDESSEAYRRSVGHVERCPDCQQRLTSMAADAESWQALSSLLQQSVHETGPPGPEDEVLARDYLGPPSHPEMLGRLGRYEIERMIGQGGMGIVWKGFDTELNRPVAIKVLARHLAHSAAARQRFAREARAAAAVVHEHVVAIHNVETDREVPFLVMQYVAGESLQARVDRVGPLSVNEVLRIGMQAAAGLASAHGQGLIHRDVKPANILLEHGVDRALLTDFGLARTVDDASLTTTGVLTGTPHYMSPEQARGDAIDPRTDLFSLGAVIYFMAAGRPPFRAEKAMGVLHRVCHERHRSLWELNADVPDALSDIVDRLLEKQPGRRIGSAASLESQLRNILARLQHHKVRPSWLRRLRHARRHSRWVLLASLLLLTVLGFARAIPRMFPRSPAPPAAEGADDQVSLQTLEMASWTEQDQFHRQLNDLEAQIRQLESNLQPTLYFQAPDDLWQRELDTMQRLLQQATRGLATAPTPVSSTKGTD